MPALGQFLGSAAGLSAAVITKLTETWKAEQKAFAARDLSGAGRRAGHGVQAHRISPRPLAHGQRTASGRSVPRRRDFINGKLVERPGEEAQPEAA